MLQLSVMQYTYYADTGVLLVMHSVIQYWLDQLVMFFCCYAVMVKVRQNIFYYCWLSCVFLQVNML